MKSTGRFFINMVDNLFTLHFGIKATVKAAAKDDFMTQKAETTAGALAAL